MELAPRVGGFPVQLYLVNSQWAVQKWSMLGKVNFGSGNSVYSRGAATLADAQALGRRLESIGQKTDVYLIKHDGCTTLSFFLADESLCENAEWMRSIEGLVRSIAPAAGGLPISLQLLNAEYEVKKRVWVT